jgi:hypothetical protein
MSMTPVTSQIFVAGPRSARTRPSTRSIVGFVLMSMALTFGIQRVVLAAPLGGSAHGALLVRGVDGSGRVSSSIDAIAIAGAYPGMAARTSTFEVRNEGSLPVAFAVNATDLVTHGPRSLDDVLRIIVSDPATGDTLYQGRLSGLLIEHTRALTAGTAVRFTVEVTWPSIAADEAYRGAGMGFSVVASPLAS